MFKVTELLSGELGFGPRWSDAVVCVLNISLAKPEFGNKLYLLIHFFKVLPDIGVNSKK